MASSSGSWSVVCDQAVLPAVLARAKKIVDYMQEQKLESHFVTLEDGTTITAQIIAGQPRVVIGPPPAAKKPPTIPPANLWVPRGFVTYPAFAGARGGVGMPIIQDMSGDAYAPINTAPGLDTSRWTAGGPCGEVLLSADKDAGYDDNLLNVPAPALYHPIKGPTFQWGGKGAYDDRPLTAEWTAYRMELSAPIARYSDENAAQAKSMFEAVNSYRVANTAVALSLPPRGYSGAAEVMVSIMQAAGTTDATSPSYPDTYKTTDDRLTKDGYTADVLKVPFTTFKRGDHPVAYELRALGGSVGSTMATWEADTDDNAILLKDVGEAAFTDVGFRGGYWAVDVIKRDRWIAAGNVSWQGNDTTLPPVTWHSFASINLAWETYPAVYDPAHYTTAPLVPIFSFTNGQGDCWLNYPRTTTAATCDVEPALGRHVYTRGRAIAMAPRGGLIWAAGVVDNGANDRLIALVHHPEEQPVDYTNEGFTRYLRVWWADIPKREHLRLDPQQTICGEDTADPWGWRGGQQLDLGTMPAPTAGFVASAGVNSLKYASCWRFSPDGLRAACLRDYGTYLDYGALQATGSGGSWTASFNARTVELTFSLTSTATTAAVTYHDYTAGITADDRLLADATPPGTHDVFNIAMFEVGAQPIAVDYTPTGALIYAYSAVVSSHQHVAYNPTDGTAGFVALCSYTYVGTGAAGATYATDLQSRVLHGARFQTPNTDAYQELAIVLDVNSAAFALKVSLPHYAITPASAVGTGVSAVARACPTFTTDAVDGVRLVRSGVVVATDWYPSPDGAIFTTNDPCYIDTPDVNMVRVFLPLAASANVQGFYATRFGERIFGYQCAPTPNATWAIPSVPSGSPCGCVVTSTNLALAYILSASAFNPRGGRAVSTVTLPAADWLIYTKVV